MAGAHTLAEPKLKVTPCAHLHPLTNVPTKRQPSAEIKSLDKIFKLMVNTTRSNQDHAMKLHTLLHPLTNVPTKYQLPTPYGF